MRTRTQFALLLLAMFAFWQGGHGVSADEAKHYPRLIRAEMPLYPPLAWTAQISGSVSIQVTVERGSVVAAQVKSASSPLLSNPAIANVKTWKFVAEDRAEFLVNYVYQIAGTETPVPENPKVEMDLPHFVKITQRPFKPTTD